jgi:uncharacterized protein (DUF1697 family)
MAELRGQFEQLGLEGVETFIASGNVIFTSDAKSTAALEKKIEKRLHEALGFEVATFIRSAEEMVALANHAPFPAARLRIAGAFCVGFLAQPLTPKAEAALAGLKTPIDDFHVNGREVYWICKTKQHESKFNNVRFEKTTGAKVTFRSTTTIAKLAAKAGAEST